LRRQVTKRQRAAPSSASEADSGTAGLDGTGLPMPGLNPIEKFIGQRKRRVNLERQIGKSRAKFPKEYRRGRALRAGLSGLGMGTCTS
jgi:hypothetical protein